MYPNLLYDSWLTIGSEDNSGSVDNIGPDFLSFEDGGNLIIDNPVGSIWYLLNGDVDGLPLEDGTVLLAQLTTDGQVSGNMFIQLFPEGDNVNFITIDLPIGGNCIVNTTNPACSYDDADGDGVCDADDACSDLSACNYSDLLATECLFDDVCGVCGGAGAVYDCGCVEVPAGDCDCDGNQEDAVGVCGGGCVTDADSDGVCDDIDDCVGSLDACGVCNGPGAIYDCGCSDIPVGDCDCLGNQLDVVSVCGGDCTADIDADGVCDDVDDCVGEFDVCGICNGPGAVNECGCDDIPAGDCDCEGNQLDVFGVCGGDCAADTDNDGICDDVDPCVGALDACGVCNGPGAVYECGCADIAEGECDCEGTLKEEVTININPDSFGSEITWSLLDDAEQRVHWLGEPSQ